MLLLLALLRLMPRLLLLRIPVLLLSVLLLLLLRRPVLLLSVIPLPLLLRVKHELLLQLLRQR